MKRFFNTLAWITAIALAIVVFCLTRDHDTITAQNALLQEQIARHNDSIATLNIAYAELEQRKDSVRIITKTIIIEKEAATKPIATLPPNELAHTFDSLAHAPHPSLLITDTILCPGPEPCLLAPLPAIRNATVSLIENPYLKQQIESQQHEIYIQEQQLNIQALAIDQKDAVIEKQDAENTNLRRENAHFQQSRQRIYRWFKTATAVAIVAIGIAAIK